MGITGLENGLKSYSHMFSVFLWNPNYIPVNHISFRHEEILNLRDLGFVLKFAMNILKHTHSFCVNDISGKIFPFSLQKMPWNSLPLSFHYRYLP